MTVTKRLVLSVIGFIILLVGGIYAYQTVGYSLSTDDALDLVYSDAGVSSSEVVTYKIKKDHDGLTATYEIEFTTAAGDYDYTINAATGAVLESDSDVSTLSSSSSSSQDSTTSISQDEAKAIALADAGLEESAVTALVVQSDTENGQAVYEITFQHLTTNQEYDYTIAANTGDILEQSVDTIDD